MNKDYESMMPEKDGLIIIGDVISAISRLSDNIAHTVYLDPPRNTFEQFFEPKEDKLSFELFLDMLVTVLRHAWRITNKQGSLFVRLPAYSPNINFSLMLGQICDGREPHQIILKTKPNKAKKNGEVRYDREILYYIPASEDSIYNAIKIPTQMKFKALEDSRGAYREVSLFVPGERPSMQYNYLGITPPPGRMWRLSQERLEKLDSEGYIHIRGNGLPRLKQYFNEMPPYELPMEWDDIEFTSPHEDKKNRNRWIWRHEPEELFNRLISMSSVESSLVIFPFCNSWSGPFVATSLERRWLALIDELDIAQYKQALATLSTSGIDMLKYNVETLDAFLSMPEYNLGSCEIAQSSLDVIELKKAVDKITFLKWDSNIERELAHDLLDYGVVAIPNFRLPGLNSISFDFYLPQPPRGIVEIKSRVSEKLIETINDIATKVHNGLGSSAKIYLVIIGENASSETIRQLVKAGIIIIQANSSKEAAKKLAIDFKPYYNREASHLLGATSFIPDRDEFSPEFMAMGITFEGLLKPNEYKVLLHEWSRLRAEWQHKHFTSAALRVGRCMEYFIYSVCRSWDVPVKEPVLLALKKLDDRFEELRSALLEYSSIDTADSPAKKNIKRHVGEISKQLIEIVSDIEDSATRHHEDKPPPRNVQAMLKDIKKKYGMIPEVRATIDNMRTPVSELLRRRNSAAHASIDGDPQEVTDIELLDMVNIFNSVTNDLAKCGLAIKQYSST
jgi:DNA modification methylase